MPRLLLCLHLIYAVSLDIMLLLATCFSTFTLQIRKCAINNSNLLEKKRRKFTSFTFTYKNCCLQASIKHFSRIAVLVIASFREKYNFKAISPTPSNPLIATLVEPMNKNIETKLGIIGLLFTHLIVH